MLQLATVSIAALQPTPRPPASLSRRHAAAALFALPTLSLRPKRAEALFGDAAFGSFLDGGAEGSLRNLANTQVRLDELAAKLKSGELRGDSPEDSIVVLQTLTIQFGGSVALLEKAASQMPLLDTSEATGLTSKFAAELANVKQGCRENSASKQLAGTEAASQVLGKFFELASSKYKLPGADSSLQYSKDPKEFAAQYYGIFSCEGQGLERIPGSNSCKDSAQNKNPFPTKKLLDFDPLTGNANQ
jgi:hypothetical protein